MWALLGTTYFNHTLNKRYVPLTTSFHRNLGARIIPFGVHDFVFVFSVIGHTLLNLELYHLLWCVPSGNGCWLVEEVLKAALGGG